MLTNFNQKIVNYFFFLLMLKLHTKNHALSYYLFKVEDLDEAFERAKVFIKLLYF